MHALGVRALKPDLKELSLSDFLEVILSQEVNEWTCFSSHTGLQVDF